jgi:hypothetical protein
LAEVIVNGQKVVIVQVEAFLHLGEVGVDGVGQLIDFLRYAGHFVVSGLQIYSVLVRKEQIYQSQRIEVRMFAL